jgi:hypothetical protein
MRVMRPGTNVWGDGILGSIAEIQLFSQTQYIVHSERFDLQGGSPQPHNKLSELFA